MYHVGTRLAAQSSWMNGHVGFYLGEYRNGSEFYRAKAISFEEEAEVFGLMAGPTFSLHRDSAQELFEQMWAQGFRSVNDKGHADRLDAARQEHLADLRKVAKIT